VEKGKQIARSLRGLGDAGGGEEEEIAETLERLARLRRAGVITEEEFRQLSGPLFERS
jgi:hypothetical protein